ncbi:MAG: diguanylate cyclase [Lachnospiraceae bacterium]|nr:diguanylate cyclase [Lachnospiraceae bacterium]
MIDQTEFNQIAATLAAHYDSVFYVDSESGHYTEIVPTQMLTTLQIALEGDDFFAMAKANASQVVHPDDLDLVLMIHDKDTIVDTVARNGSYSVSCRLIIDGNILHIRHVDMMCEDKKHILFCMENIDDEVREKEIQQQKLHNAERMARLDELTGIKNHNAFMELSKSMDNSIRTVEADLRFGIVICDVNDLKLYNDTRGHSFGDEFIRRACRMISENFSRSRIYRIGGDEFAVFLTDEEYEIREELLENLRRESYANGRSRSGPVIATGMSVYEPSSDAKFSDVVNRADLAMYENKKMIKSGKPVDRVGTATMVEIPIPDGRKRKLDAMFGALVTIAGDGYVFLNDLRYDYSRWSAVLTDDYGFGSEYMYHAGKIWQEYVHPDDLAKYKSIVDSIIGGKGDPKDLNYRARRPDGSYVVLQPRAFVLCDDDGKPEYYGGIIIQH